MALYGPRTQKSRSRSNSLAHFGAGPPTPARARTPTSAQRGARDGKPIVTVEDLLDRILSELRKDANSLDAAGFPGSLRDRVLKLMKSFYNGPRKGKILDPGDDGKGSPLARAGINVAELRVEELEAELAQHRMRTAALRSEMANMQNELESMPKQSRMYARELNEARATTAFVRTQLAEAKSQLRQAEERTQEAEAQWRLAEDRAARAEWRVKSYTDEEQWTRLEFVKHSKEQSESAGDGRVRMIKARVDRERAALEKKGPAWKPGGVRPPRSATPRGEQASTPVDGGSPALSVSPRAAPRPGSAAREVAVATPAAAVEKASVPKARSASPAAKAKAGAKAKEGPLICAYCNKPVDGSPAPKQPAKDPNSDPTVIELKRKHKAEMDKLKKLERQTADQTARHMAFRYNRLVSGRLKHRVLVCYRALVNKLRMEKSKKAVEESYKGELAAINELETKTAEQREANAEKMAMAYYNRLCKELQKFLLSEWNMFTIKSSAFKKAQDQAQELAQLQAANAKAMERGGEIAEQVADKWQAKRNAKLLDSVVDMWGRLALEQRASKKVEDELHELKKQREEEKRLEQAHSEDVAENMAKKYRAKVNKDLERAVVGCWYRAAMTHKRQIEVEQLLAKLKEEQVSLQSQYDDLSEEKEEQLVQKYRRHLQKELGRNVFFRWLKESMKGSAQRRLDKELNQLKTQERERGDDIAEQMADQFQKKLEMEIMTQCLTSWGVLTLKEKTKSAKSAVDKDLEQLKEQHAREVAELMEKFGEHDDEQISAHEELHGEMESLKRQLADLEGQSDRMEKTKTMEVERLKKQLADAQQQQTKNLAEAEERQRLQARKAEEMERLMEEKTCEQLVFKYHRKLDEMTLRRMNGAWFKVARTAKLEAEKQRLEQQLHREMDAQLEEMKELREKEIQELKKHDEEELQLVLDNASDDKKQETERLKAEKEKKMLARAEKMADVQCKKNSTRFMRNIMMGWYQAQVAAVAQRLKEESQKELEKLKSQSRQRGGFVAEQMADRAYAEYLASIMTSVSRAWRDGVQMSVAERLKRNAEEQLHEERKKQEEILQKEKEQLQREKEKMKKQQEQFQKKHIENIDEELNRLLEEEREKGDHTAELMAEQMAKKQQYQLLAFITNEWQELTIRDAVKREHEKHEKRVQAMKLEREKELEEMKKYYATMDKEKDKAFREKEAERMSVHFRKRIDDKLQGRCLQAWVKSAQISRREKEEKQRQEQFNAELERLARLDRARGDAHAEQMADMQYAKRLDALMNVITSEWHQAFLAAEAEREQEAQKRKHEKELEKLKQQQREAGDEIAEQMADQQAARRELDLLREVFQELQDEVVKAKEAKAENAIQEKEAQLSQLREARAQEVQALQREQQEMEEKLARGEQLLEKEKRQQALKQQEMVRRADAHAKQMAVQFRQKANLENMRVLFVSWEQECRSAMQEKREARLRQAHDADLDALKRQRAQDQSNKEQFAEQMSERYYKKICQSLLEQVMQAWHAAMALEIAEREAQEQKREAARELEDLKRKAKIQGDRDAQQLAMQYERKLRADFLRDIWHLWIQAITEDKAEREKERMQQQQEAEIEKVKRKEQVRVEAERHRMVMEYQKKLMHTLLLDIVDTWSDNVAARRAARREREAKEQMDAELQALKEQSRQKGDDTAKMLAEKFHKKICYEIIKETFSPWRRLVAEDKAAKNLEKMKRQQDEEMNRIKREQLERLDGQASVIAKKFRKKKLETLAQRCVSNWRRSVLETQAEKIISNLTRQCELKIQVTRKKIDKLADWTATHFLKAKMVPVLQRCIFWWYHRFQIEVVEYEAQLQLQEEESKLEVDLARIHNLHVSRMDALLEMLVRKRGDTEKWLLLQRTMWGWSEARIAVKNEDFVAKEQRRMDIDTAEMARVQDRAKRELVLTVSEWQLGNLERPTTMCFYLLWTLLTQDARNKHEVEAEITRLEEEAEAVKRERLRRSEFGIARMAEIIESSVNMNVQRKAFGFWRDDHWRETFIEVEKTRQKEHQAEIIKLEVEQMKQRQNRSDVLGNFIERLGNVSALRICVRYWYHDTWTSRILDRHKEQINSLQARHNEELTEAKEIVETQRSEMQILRTPKVEGRKSLKEDAKASQADDLRRGSRGPKKRLEEGRDSPTADEEPRFKPRLRTSLANRMLDEFDEEGGARLQDQLSKSKETRRSRFAEAEEEAEEAAEKHAPKKSSLSKERPTRKRFSFEQSAEGKKQFSFDRRDGSGSSSDV